MAINATTVERPIPGGKVLAVTSLGTTGVVEIPSDIIDDEHTLIVVKDETGLASSILPITVQTQGSETVDGLASVTIGDAYGSRSFYTADGNLFSLQAGVASAGGAAGGNSTTYEAHTANDTLTESESESVHSNAGASGMVTLSLPPNPSANVRLTFVRVADEVVRLEPGDNDAYRWSGGQLSDGFYIELRSVGAVLEVVSDEDSNWVAIREFGALSAEVGE